MSKIESYLRTYLWGDTTPHVTGGTMWDTGGSTDAAHYKGNKGMTVIHFLTL
jgi:hypothetical protein